MAAGEAPLLFASAPAGPGALELAAQLDLPAARPLQDAFLARRGTDLAVDASAVRRVGGLCLQVLLAAAEAWKADGRSLAFHGSSPDFLDGLELMGALPNGRTACAGGAVVGEAVVEKAVVGELA